ncbi:ATP-binding protein [Solilutibacter silvestris]|uniref:histidine kinase n=1 Tax=Solilutibacter silvestris TaxID=1645665 RepID=A0A2K1Q279_9GAMM|nr:ATP-binding protein [Lysobacter silvestris]PNS09146.1 Signal transduction histidine kinase [Lysobacter silvestris]
MRISISQRIFLATFGAALLMAIVGLEVVRWTLLDNFSARLYSLDAQWRELEPLENRLGERYQAEGGWNFLPTDPAARKYWLRDALGEAKTSPTLGQRIALLDWDDRYLAGIRPARPLIVFASINTGVHPLRVQGRTIGYLQIAAPAHAEDELAVAFLMDQQEHLLVLGVLAILSMACVSLLLAARIRKPVRELVDGARRLEKGEFDARLDATRNDELGELALAFNRLAARLQSMRGEQRRWVADTSHELRTPLAVLQAQIEALADGVRPATPEHIQLMSRQTKGLIRIVDDLHMLAKADAGRLELQKASCAVWPLVEEATRAFAERFREAGLSMSFTEVPSRSDVSGDDVRLRQVIDNLLENGVRHTDAGGCIEIGGRVVGNALHLVFDDSAPGVPSESLPRLGERFFRVDASRTRLRGVGGSGLGLALCRQIVEAHDGRLMFAASPLGGLRTTIVLPLEA